MRVEQLQAVGFRRLSRADRRDVEPLFLCDVTGCDGGVGARDALPAHPLDGGRALTQCLRMRADDLDVLRLRLSERRKAVVDRHVQRADDIEAVLEYQVIDRRDGACRGVLDGQHAVAHLAAVHRGEHVVEPLVVAQLRVRKENLRRFVTVRALDALIADEDVLPLEGVGRVRELFAQLLSRADDFVLQSARQLHDVLIHQPRVDAVLAALLLNAVEDLLLAVEVEHGHAVFLFILADCLRAVHPAAEQRDKLLVNAVDLRPDFR